MLDDGRLGLRVVLRVAESVAFEQVGARKRLGADLALVGLFLGVHAHVATQVIETGIALGALATRVQPGGGGGLRAGGRLGFLLLGRGAVVGRRRRGSSVRSGGSGSRGVVV